MVVPISDGQPKEPTSCHGVSEGSVTHALNVTARRTIPRQKADVLNADMRFMIIVDCVRKLEPNEQSVPSFEHQALVICAGLCRDAARLCVFEKSIALAGDAVPVATETRACLQTEVISHEVRGDEIARNFHVMSGSTECRFE